MSFHIYSLILIGGFLANIVAHSINTHVICDNVHNELHYLRNSAIRVILSDELNRTKLKYSIIKRMINRNFLNKYNKVISSCYDLNYNYNCLTEAEKTLLEVIVSLTY
jgi:ribosomal protein S8